MHYTGRQGTLSVYVSRISTFITQPVLYSVSLFRGVVKDLFLDNRRLTLYWSLIGVLTFAAALTFHRETMDNRLNILRVCIDGSLELQKQALFALQQLMHRLEYPNSKWSLH